jgi:hypothetical protein
MAAAKVMRVPVMTHFGRNFALDRVVPESHKVVRFETGGPPSCAGQVVACAGWVNPVTLGSQKKYEVEVVARVGVFGLSALLAVLGVKAVAARQPDR